MLFQVRGGREVDLDSLHQELTYGGLLEGVPNARMNQLLIDRTVLKVTCAGGEKGPLVLPYREEPIDFGGKLFLGSEPRSLPGITCWARLCSSRPARRAEADYSILTIIWFQSTWAFPIDSEVLLHIAEIDWDSHAEDMEY